LNARHESLLIRGVPRLIRFTSTMKRSNR